MTFSIHERNKLNNIYVLGRGEIQGVATVGPTANSGKTEKKTTMYVEILYKTNFTEPNEKFVLSLHYNHDNSYLFVNGAQELRFKSKIEANDLKQHLLCLENLSSNWSLTNSTKAGMYGSVYDFAVDYVAINGVKTIYDIHRYLMTKHNI